MSIVVCDRERLTLHHSHVSCSAAQVPARGTTGFHQNKNKLRNHALGFPIGLTSQEIGEQDRNDAERQYARALRLARID